MRVWDRVVFGAIASAFGAALGLGVALVAAMIFRTTAGLFTCVLFSVICFFAVGTVRGPDAGFLVGEVLHVAGMAVRAEAVDNAVLPDRAEHQDQPRSWRSFWLVVVWVIGIAVLTWLA